MANLVISVDLLVIHCISLPPGQYGGNEIEAFFTNQLDINTHAYFAEICHLQVSSHVLIRRCGDVLQFVNFNDRLHCFHAGVEPQRYDGSLTSGSRWTAHATKPASVSSNQAQVHNGLQQSETATIYLNQGDVVSLRVRGEPPSAFLIPTQMW